MRGPRDAVTYWRLAHRLYPAPKTQPGNAAAFWRGEARERKKECPQGRSDWSGLCDDEGGGADVEKTVAQGNLFSGGYRDSHVPVSHKRVLTAWLAPKRSTDKVD